MRTIFGSVSGGFALVAVLLMGAVASNGCASRKDGLLLNVPDWIDSGTTLTVTATSPEGGVRVQIYDRRGAVVLDSKEEVAEGGDSTNVRLFWQVPFDAKEPLRIEATDRTGAKRSRVVRRR